jgi:hypothetical protein
VPHKHGATSLPTSGNRILVPLARRRPCRPKTSAVLTAEGARRRLASRLLGPVDQMKSECSQQQARTKH